MTVQQNHGLGYVLDEGGYAYQLPHPTKKSTLTPWKTPNLDMDGMTVWVNLMPNALMTSNSSTTRPTPRSKAEAY